MFPLADWQVDFVFRNCAYLPISATPNCVSVRACSSPLAYMICGIILRLSIMAGPLGSAVDFTSSLCPGSLLDSSVLRRVSQVPKWPAEPV